MHPARIFLILIIAFCLGITIGSFINSKWLNASYVSIAGIMLVVFCWRDSWRFVICGLAVILFAFGYSRIISYRNMTSNLVVVGSIDTYRGFVAGEPDIGGANQKLKVLVTEINSDEYSVYPEYILATTARYPEYKYGDNIEIAGMLKSPDKFDEDFDYPMYLAKEGIYATMFNPQISRIDDLNLSVYIKTKKFFWQNILAVKRIFKNALNTSVPEPEAAFIAGTLLGGSGGLPESIQDDFRATGTTHVMAVSGYNVAIIITLLSGLLLLFFKRRAAFYGMLSLVFVFVILTGAQASVVRAALMAVIGLSALNLGRLYDGGNALLLTAAIMLFYNPLLLRYDIGFQLSFAATVGLLYLRPHAEKLFTRLPNFYFIRDSLSTTISAQLAVLPILLIQFNSVPIISLPANVALLPMIPITMVTGFIGGIVSMVSGTLGRVAGYGAWLPAKICLEIVEFFARLV